MTILMDSDCLIKLTKAGLKEPICRYEKIAIPMNVKREVVDEGKGGGHADAEMVELNIENGLIACAKEKIDRHLKGDQSLIETFREGRYSAVATDDAKLVRILRSVHIPFILPGMLIHAILKKGEIDQDTGLEWLDKLSPYISEDEYSLSKLLLEGES
jgi:rRNA-processing protein FCF1